MFAENDASTPYAIRKRWGKLKCKCGGNEFAFVEDKAFDRSCFACSKCGQGYQVVK
jgi:hypothetical protein